MRSGKGRAGACKITLSELTRLTLPQKCCAWPGPCGRQSQASMGVRANPRCRAWSSLRTDRPRGRASTGWSQIVFCHASGKRSLPALLLVLVHGDGPNHSPEGKPFSAVTFGLGASREQLRSAGDKVVDGRRRPSGDGLNVVGEAIVPIVGMKTGHRKEVFEDVLR